MMRVPLKNILSVDIKRNQSHEELRRYIQAKQEAAQIRQLDCSIYVCEEQFGIQHPLYSFIQSTPTLEHVKFSGFDDENVSIDALLDAISQNHSIYTVDLYKIDCSTYAILQLMEQKMKWKVWFCCFIGHPPTLNKFTSYIEELFIQTNDLSVMDFMAKIPSWPFLCQLSIGIPLKLELVHYLEHIICGLPILQELTLGYIHFDDPDVIHSFSTLVFNSPSPDLKWHLNDCKFFPNTMAVLENIIKSEKAKSMWIKLTLQKFLNGTDNYQVLPTILSESLHVGNSDIIDEHGDAMLDILLLL